MISPMRSIKSWFSRVSKTRKDRRRRLLLESLEKRELLASDLAAIAGTVFTDATDNGLTGDDTRHAGILVSLYEQGNAIAIATQVTNGSGEYRFDGLSAGTYVVVQDPVSGTLQRADQTTQTITITADDADGTHGMNIDSYDNTSQSAVAEMSDPSKESSEPAPEALGGERDFSVQWVSGTDDLALRANRNGNQRLTFNAGQGTAGDRIVSWDGIDDNGLTLNATGLNHADLTENGQNIGFRMALGADQNDGIATFRVYTDAGNVSTVSIAIPNTGPSAAPDVSVLILFSDFVVLQGNGADFSDVGAIEMEIEGVASVDGSMDELGMLRPTVIQRNFANLPPLSLGDTVWFDADNSGTKNGSESGIQGVAIVLYEDTDASGNYTPGTDVQLDTDTTDIDGLYRFENLMPGSYVVQVAASNFDSVGALAGMVSSSGNGVAPDPDLTDLNDDDNGDALTGHGVVTPAVTLSAGGEPIDDGDSDQNTNLAVDLGFSLVADLSVIKSDNPDPVNAGDTLTYTLTVTNHGPSPATGVVLTDDLPAGVTFVDVQTADGTVSHSNGTVTANLNNLPIDGTATVVVTVTVDSSQTDNLLNVAQVTAEPVDPVPENNRTEEPTQVLKRINLNIVKTDSVDPVVAGGQLVYTLVVTNAGPSDASNVQVIDNLPDEMVYALATTTQGTVSHSNGAVSVDLGDMVRGATATITITTDVDPGARGTVLNEALVTAAEQEIDNQDNSTTEPTTIVGQVDLRITKTDDPDPVVAGNQLEYTLTVTNDGPSDATGVQITDVLPGVLSYVSASGAGTVSQSGQTITINLGDLDVGQSATTKLLVDVDPGTRSTIFNTATVDAVEEELDEQNNTATAETNVLAEIDLVIVKSDSPDPVAAGSQLTYTLLVTNNGPSDATGVTVTDELPAGLTYITGQTTKGAVGALGRDVTANIGDLGAGESATITLTVSVGGSLSGTVLNVAEVEGNEVETNTANNRSEQPTTIDPRIDLAIVKSDSDDPAVAGETLVYTLLVTNNGPSDATGVAVVDTLPDGVSFVSATTTQGTFSQTGNTVNFDLGALDDTQSATMTITVMVDPSARGTILNTASVSGNEEEITLANNNDEEETTIRAEVDLAIIKADSPDPVVAGEVLTYTLSVINHGPSDATNVVVTDDLPDGVSYRSSSSSQGTVSVNNDKITIDLGDLASGASATITIEVDVDSSTLGQIINTAEVESLEMEIVPGNNVDDEPTTVQAEVDLAITKTDSADPISAGDQLTYTLVVTNNGPSDATNITVTDELPDEAVYKSASGAGSVTHVSGVVSIELASLAAGASETITIVTEIDPATRTTTISNRATVASSQTDRVPGNNTALEPTAVDELLGRLAGYVYVDTDNDGQMDPGEKPISGVTVRLERTDATDGQTAWETLTAADGSYEFNDLLSGVYRILESQPAGYLDGKETPGEYQQVVQANGATPPADPTVLEDEFADIELRPGDASFDFLFGELVPVFSKRRFIGR